MKKATAIIALAAAIALSGCRASKASVAEASEISWQAFCAARGYDPADNTFQAINEYFDAWCGTVEEEAVLAKAGIRNL